MAATDGERGPVMRTGTWRGVAGVTAAAAVAVAGALGGIAASGHTGTPGRSDAAAAYLTIATAGSKRLETDFDRLQGPDRGNLAATESDLRDSADTEHLFDERLAALALSPAAEAKARALISVNEARVTLTRKAATSATLAELAGYQPWVTAADAPVEQAVLAMRAELGLPPPESD